MNRSSEARQMLNSPDFAFLPPEVRAATLANIERMEQEEEARRAEWAATRGADRPNARPGKRIVTPGRIA